MILGVQKLDVFLMKLHGQLALGRCPHCNIDNPNLIQHWGPFNTTDYRKQNPRFWCLYMCLSCGGGVLAAAANAQDAPITEVYPEGHAVDSAVPEVARDYLQQANETLHAPAGAIMLAASAVDAMLKEKEYTDGTLYERIVRATENHLLTEEMSQWAHIVRLDANAQRHADEESSMPTAEEAKRTLHFANALAQFLFVLPNMVAEGIREASQPPNDPTNTGEEDNETNE
jgi:hypothetical protein